MSVKATYSTLLPLLVLVGGCSPSPKNVDLKYQLYFEEGRFYPPGVEVYAGKQRIGSVTTRGKGEKRQTSSIISRKGSRPLSREALKLRWLSPCGPQQSPLTFGDSQFQRREKSELKRPSGATISVSVKEKSPKGWGAGAPVYFFVDYGDGSRTIRVGKRTLKKPKDKIADEVYGLRCAASHNVRIGAMSVGTLANPKTKYVFIGQPKSCYHLQKKIYTSYSGLSSEAPKKIEGGKVHVLREFVDYFLVAAPKNIRVRSGSKFEHRYSLTKVDCGS